MSCAVILTLTLSETKRKGKDLLFLFRFRNGLKPVPTRNPVSKRTLRETDTC